jgi:GDP-L-fucose synthase
MTNVLILGRGLVGNALYEYLITNTKYTVHSLGKSDLDLRDFHAVEENFRRINPDIVILAAGVVGGIEKNIAEPYVL